MKKKCISKTWSTPVAAEASSLVPCCLCNNTNFKTALICENFSYVRCTNCDLVQMNPQPLADDVLKRYEKTYGNDYLNYEINNENAFLKLQQLALKDAGFYDFEQELMPNPNPPKFLDIGCATGALLFLLKQRGWQVCGVEISPAAEYARRERSLDVRSLPLEENNFNAGSFDVILASHLIEHLNDPAQFARETYRLLKNNGRLYITTPNIAGFQARVFGSAWRSAIFDHLCLFSVKTLGALLSNAGYTIESVCTWGGLAAGTAPVWLKKIVDRAVKKPGWGDVMIVRALKQGNGLSLKQ